MSQILCHIFGLTLYLFLQVVAVSLAGRFSGGQFSGSELKARIQLLICPTTNTVT